MQGNRALRWLSRLWRPLVFAALAALVLVFFRAWLGPGLPSSHRSELVPQITYIWQIAEYLRAGHLYVHWDPSFFAGYTWLRFLPYPVYYVAALLSLLPWLSLFSAIKTVFISAYIASAWTMAELVHAVVIAQLAPTRAGRRGAQGMGPHAQAIMPVVRRMPAAPTRAGPASLSDTGRHEAVAWAAALVAGAAYAVFPFHLHLGIEIVHHAVTWALLPLPFLVYERALYQGKLGARTGIVLGVVFAVMGVVDSEHPLILAPFLALYLILRILPDLRRCWQGALAMLLMAALVALGLAAFFVLPAATEISQVGIAARFGQGGTANEEFARNTGLSIGALLAGAADRAGIRYRPVDLPYIVYGFFGGNAWYLGLATTVLAVLGLARVRRSPVAALATLLLLLAFAWSARAWLPVNPFRSIPFFGTLSGFRGMMLIGFFLCLLAGFGAAWLLASLKRPAAWGVLAAITVGVLLMDRPRPTVSYLAAALGLLVLLAAIVFLGHKRLQSDLARADGDSRAVSAGVQGLHPERPVSETAAGREARTPAIAAVALAALLLLGLVAVDYRPAAAAVVSVPRYLEADEEQAYRWLAGQGSGFRVWEYSDLYDDAEFLHTFSLTHSGIPHFGGYYDNGAPRWQWQLYKWAKPERGTKPPGAEVLSTALRLSSVRFLLVHRRLGTYDEALGVARSMGLAPVWQSANLVILEDPAWQTMARLYSRAVYAAGGVSELDILPRVQRANLVLLSGEGAQSSGVLWREDLPAAAAPVPATITRPSPTTIAVQANLAAPGVLVVGESWHPGWRVTVDGKALPVLRADVAFLAVRLDAGKHDVVYSFRPPLSWPLGWAITILTALGLIGNALAVWCRRT